MTTDIHLNFLTSAERKIFYKYISQLNTNAILITGDIGEATDVCELLNEMNINIHKPIYFVLGNHDYYFGSVSDRVMKIGYLIFLQRRLEISLLQLHKNIRR